MTPDDDVIRSRLHADANATGSSAPASVVYGQLRPRLRRARRMRRIAIGTTSVVLIGGTAAALQASLGGRTTTVRTFESNERGPVVDDLTAGPAKTDAARDDGSDSSTDRAPSTRPDASVTTTSTSEPTPSTSATAPASPGIGVPAVSIPGPPTVPVTEPSASVVDSTIASTTPVATDPPPSTPSIGTRRIDSACGSIVVETVDDRVSLVDVLANPGADVDVKNDGPDHVEVGLHDGDEECELDARVIDGQLVTTVKGPDSDESSEQHGPGDD